MIFFTRLYYEAGIKKARDIRAERSYAVNTERAMWQSVVAEKDFTIAEQASAFAAQAAEIATLKSQSSLQF